jgi:hypothetical protein
MGCFLWAFLFGKGVMILVNIINLRYLVVVGMVIAAFTLMSAGAFAKGPTAVPGWGFGDTNHTHTGPPGGPSVHPVK